MSTAQFSNHCTGHCSSDVSNQHRASVQLFLCLCQRQQAGVQAANVVSTINFNSAIYNYDTLCVMLYYDACCLIHYHHYHNIVHRFFSCPPGVPKSELHLSNWQCSNPSGQYSSISIMLTRQGTIFHSSYSLWSVIHFSCTSGEYQILPAVPSMNIHLRWHLTECVWDFLIGWVTFSVTPNIYSSTLSCFQTYHNHSHGASVPVISDSSDSECWLDYPARVQFTPKIVSCKFTLHLLSYTCGCSQWLY